MPPHVVNKPMTTPTTASRGNEAQLSAHIMSVSAGLVGVCLTVIGLFRVMLRAQHVGTVAVNLLAVNAVLLLTACVLAYLALRGSTAARWRLERAADLVFLLGLSIMVATGVLVAFEVI